MMFISLYPSSLDKCEAINFSGEPCKGNVGYVVNYKSKKIAVCHVHRTYFAAHGRIVIKEVMDEKTN